MEKIRLSNVESQTGPASVKRPLTEALGATNLALNYYELAPGDSFAYGLHAHDAQEEVFYVQAGTVTFETADEPVMASAGDVVRFAPGEFQRGVNEADERVVALALGAPRESGALDLRRHCETCDEMTPNTIDSTESGDIVTLCDRCGAETDRFE